MIRITFPLLLRCYVLNRTQTEMVVFGFPLRHHQGLRAEANYEVIGAIFFAYETCNLHFYSSIWFVGARVRSEEQRIRVAATSNPGQQLSCRGGV